MSRRYCLLFGDEALRINALIVRDKRGFDNFFQLDFIQMFSIYTDLI